MLTTVVYLGYGIAVVRRVGLSFFSKPVLGEVCYTYGTGHLLTLR